jgi:hypothetical protein
MHHISINLITIAIPGYHVRSLLSMSRISKGLANVRGTTKPRRNALVQDLTDRCDFHRVAIQHPGAASRANPGHLQRGFANIEYHFD